MFEALLSLYRPRYAMVLTYMLQNSDYRMSEFLKWYWRTQNFSHIMQPPMLNRTRTARRLWFSLRLAMLLQIAVGIWLIVLGARGQLAGGVYFGVATVVSYPVVWAHLLAFLVAAEKLTHPKKVGKAILCRLLETQVRELRKRNSFKVIAVAGSVGKTSTKLAIARVLSTKKRVMYQEGNYNDRLTVPLVLFGQSEPNILNVWAWLKIYVRNERMLHKPYPYDYVVLELGIDGLGQMRQFAYLHPDITVVTAVAPEHMECLYTLDLVAKEELRVFDFSSQTLVNIDDVAPEYLQGRQYTGYGLSSKADYRVTNRRTYGLAAQKLTFKLPKAQFTATVQLVGEHGAKMALAAAAVSSLCGVKPTDIQKSLETLEPFAGRMQILEGAKGSTIIDDTYNASPTAVKVALDVLYATEAAQHIAILGSMNELGSTSAEAHRDAGEYCDPAKLDYVVALGEEACRHLAPAAKEAGCRVECCMNSIEAAEFIKKKLKTGAVILAKGSQNGVFAEEVVKQLLAHPEDKAKLVRQSANWLAIKQKQI